MIKELNIPTKAPNVTLKTRMRDESIRGDGPYKWEDVQTKDLFNGKKIVLFSLPGAFTPTCSSTHLPGYEKKYQELKDLGVDEVYCISVNDAFVMNKWGEDLSVSKVKLLPDGSGDFTREMGMLVKKDNLGFGERSWRYSMFVDDGNIKKTFVEEGFSDNFEDDPFEVSDVDTMIEYIKSEG